MPGILIDVVRLLIRRSVGYFPTGIDRVAVEYIRRYGARARAVLSWGPLAGALSRSESSRLFGGLLDRNIAIVPLALEMVARSVAWSWIFPGTSNSILIVTSKPWLHSRHYAAQLRRLGARPVFFVHDLIPVSHPEYFSVQHGRDFRGFLDNALRMGRGIIVNSRDTESALRRYADNLGLQHPPVAVAPLASGLTQLPVPGPRPAVEIYYVMLGTIEPRKNHFLLLHIWRELVARRSGPIPRLYVIGQRGWECENVVDLLERCAPLRGIVIERNDCGDAELATLLRHAQALLMPTFAEGFGLPIAEALAFGVPVIASDLPVFREVAGEIPEYLDPIDGRGWMEMILDYAQPGSARRAAQLDRLKGYRAATWAQHFDIVDRFLETLP